MGSLRIKRKTQTNRLDFINDSLDIKIDEIGIDRSHRIGCFDKVKKKARPIIVKLARYNTRGRVFREKWKLKGTGKIIIENLTTKRIGQLNDTREKYSFNNVWSYDGKIMCKINNEFYNNKINNSFHLLYSVHTFPRDLIRM